MFQSITRRWIELQANRHWYNAKDVHRFECMARHGRMIPIRCDIQVG
jgi:hypothetical protein